MSDEDALLAAIAAHPGEDTPRLAYADWLDEHDRPARAEFIRLQIEIGNLVRSVSAARGPEFDELLRRERELLAAIRPEQLGPLATLRDDFEATFDRGFVAKLQMYAGVFVQHAAHVAALRPPPTVVLTDVADLWYDVITSPHLPAVTHLVMTSQPYPTDWSLAAFVVRTMGALGAHNRLRGLSLARCRVGDQGLVFLAERADVWRLEELDLSANDIQYGLLDLIESPITRTLRRVNLSHNPITELGAVVLAERWPTGSPLRHLDLRYTDIGPDGERALRARFGGVVVL
jgi:uncharacterized protein (TIGR02996 family)